MKIILLAKLISNSAFLLQLFLILETYQKCMQLFWLERYAIIIGCN